MAGSTVALRQAPTVEDGGVVVVARLITATVMPTMEVFGVASAVVALEGARVVNFLSIHPDVDQSNQVYREQRRAYYQRFPTFWGTIAGAAREEYALYEALEISHEQATALRTASARLYQLLTRLGRMLQQADDQALLHIGIPACAIPYAHIVIPHMPAVMCGRFEFAMTNEGPKLLEFNAETPSFVVELFHINSQVCADFGLSDPNAHCQAQLAQAIHATITAAIRWIRPHPFYRACVVFSSYADNLEERSTTKLYQRLLTSSRTLPYRTSYHGLDELRVTPDYLYTAQGERIDVLYKLYPTEYLVDDEAEDGTAVGLALLSLVRKRRLAIINPPSAFVLQSKALIALLWKMHQERHTLFTAQEHQWIAQYILPTYVHTNHALLPGCYVTKPVYGREGASIILQNGHEILEQSNDHLYSDQLMIDQQYAQLPTALVQTEEGEAHVNLVHNCFVVAGTPSAIGIRASHKLILDDTSYFLPVCYPRGE